MSTVDKMLVYTPRFSTFVRRGRDPVLGRATDCTRQIDFVFLMLLKWVKQQYTRSNDLETKTPI